MSSLEDQVKLLLKQNTTTQTGDGTLDSIPSFSQPTQNDFGMPGGSFLKLNDANLAVVTIGVIVSSSVGGMISNWMPSVSKYGTIIAGVAIMYVGKNKKMVRDLGAGVLIGGLAEMFSGLGSSLGSHFSQPNQNMMAEDRVTYGGTDGIYPTQPDRRVMA